MRLAFELLCGVVGLWIAAKLWLGGAGPLGQCILRLAGIYAASDAVALVAQPLLLLGWLFSVGVYLGALMWLFELDPAESIMLALITYVLKVAAGFALLLMLTAN